MELNDVGTVGLSTFCCSITSFLVSKRLADLSDQKIRTSSFLVLTQMGVTWLFGLVSACSPVVHDVFPDFCYPTLLICVLIYAGAKLVMYIFFAEKLRMVSQSRSRFKNKLYMTTLALLSLYLIIVFLMLKWYYMENNNENGKCRIGLQKIAALPLIMYDTLFSAWQCILFVRRWEQLKNSLSASSGMSILARRYVLACSVCVVISFLNILGLLLRGNGYKSSICFSVCTIDLTLNAISIFWMTNLKIEEVGQGIDQLEANARKSITQQSIVPSLKNIFPKHPCIRPFHVPNALAEGHELSNKKESAIQNLDLNDNSKSKTGKNESSDRDSRGTGSQITHKKADTLSPDMSNEIQDEEKHPVNNRKDITATCNPEIGVVRKVPLFIDVNENQNEDRVFGKKSGNRSSANNGISFDNEKEPCCIIFPMTPSGSRRYSRSKRSNGHRASIDSRRSMDNRFLSTRRDSFRMSGSFSIGSISDIDPIGSACLALL